MNPKTIRIKIIKTNNPYSWYKNNIGDIFEVSSEIRFKGTSTAMYRLINSDKMVYLRNCEVIIDKEIYPTLIEEYKI